MRSYAGIGSRSTWEDVCLLMTRIAVRLREQGVVLRSGHATGADQAFEVGAFGHAEVYLPWSGFNDDVPVLGQSYLATDAAYEMAAEYHEWWGGLSRGSRALMARNMHQVLGIGLDDPVDLVICWTPNASRTGDEAWTGGTGQALRVAVAHDIPVLNLRDEHDMHEAKRRFEL